MLFVSPLKYMRLIHLNTSIFRSLVTFFQGHYHLLLESQSLAPGHSLQKVWHRPNRRPPLRPLRQRPRSRRKQLARLRPKGRLSRSRSRNRHRTSELAVDCLRHTFRVLYVLLCSSRLLETSVRSEWLPNSRPLNFHRSYGSFPC